MPGCIPRWPHHRTLAEEVLEIQLYRNAHGALCMRHVYRKEYMFDRRYTWPRQARKLPEGKCHDNLLYQYLDRLYPEVTLPQKRGEGAQSTAVPEQARNNEESRDRRGLVAVPVAGGNIYVVYRYINVMPPLKAGGRRSAK